MIVKGRGGELKTEEIISSRSGGDASLSGRREEGVTSGHSWRALS